MASRSLLPLIDLLIEGGIEQFLTDAKARGESNRTIAAKLSELLPIEVSHPTIAAWCNQFQISKGEAAS